MGIDIKNAIAKDGSNVQFVWTNDPPSGTMKYVFFSPNKDYVVAFYHDKKQPDYRQKDRIERIVTKYRDDIMNQEGGDYWKQLFCWPEKVVEWNGKFGIVVPAYGKDFFFQKDPIRKGKEKEGKWFASAKLIRMIAPEERGNFYNFLKISLKLAQAVRRMHAAGLAHSDLSYKNVLIDPTSGKACVIDCDGLVVPQKYPPEVLGTPDFIAPEVIKSMELPQDKRTMPSQSTDKHALAVLIYMYLLHRHPLQGGRYFGSDIDSDQEEKLLMGSDPLFIEHPINHTNRNMKREYGDKYDSCRPWVDLDDFPAEKICGPHLWNLFQRAFIDGLKEPIKRPSANDWEIALIKTSDIILKCKNQKCPQQFFVYDNSKYPRCPFCGTPYQDKLPVLNFYIKGKDTYNSDGSRLLVWDGQSLFKWHVYKGLSPNEKLKPEDKGRVGYFQFHQGEWILVNEKIYDMFEIQETGDKHQILPGQFVKLHEGTKILLSTAENGKVVVVQMAGE